jgi:hypothetical protein
VDSTVKNENKNRAQLLAMQGEELPDHAGDARWSEAPQPQEVLQSLQQAHGAQRNEVIETGA